MKKFLLIIFLFAGLILTGCKRKTTEEKMQYTVEKFVEYVKTNKLDSASIIYPTCNFYNFIDVGSVSVLKVKKDSIFDDTYKIICNNKVKNTSYGLVNRQLIFWMSPNNDKNKEIQVINESCGLINLKAQFRLFLIKTGAIYENSTDNQIINNMQTYIDFAKYYSNNTGENLEQLASRKYSGAEFRLYDFNHPIPGVNFEK